MPDLFASSPQVIPLPGSGTGCELRYYPQFLSSVEADRLLLVLMDRVAWHQSSIQISCKEMAIPRLNAWYGDAGANYGYSGVRLPTNPWFEELTDIRERVNAETKCFFNSALLNLYRDGRDSVAWHSDDEPELGPSPLIVSISLGAARRFELREKQLPQKGKRERFSLELRHGALLVMAGNTQHYWQHQIPKEPTVTEPRINITFRVVT